MQCYVDPILKRFGERFVTRWNLQAYSNPQAPAVFYGLYPHLSRKTLAAHRGLAIIVWGGSDFLYATTELLELLQSKKNIRHIAPSPWIANDLRLAGIPFKYLPVCCCNLDSFDTSPLGTAVYFYSPPVASADVYGSEMVKRIRKKIPTVPFLFAWNRGRGSVPHDRVKELYKQCFIGLRLTRHDGLSTTVAELGLAGRRCVWNGDSPNAIPWATTDDVITAIVKEREKIGQVREDIAKKVYQWLDVGNDWLREDNG
jgi:hypothetical protein